MGVRKNIKNIINLILSIARKREKKTIRSNTSTSTTISTSAIQEIVEKLKGERIKDSTKKIYYSVWKKFNNFFIKLDQKPEQWEERIVLYIAYLIEEKRCSQTIKSYISALRAVLRDDGVELNEDKFLLTAMTKACKYKNDKVTTRLPIQKGMLRMLLSEVNSKYNTKNPQEYLFTLYSAIFSTAYYGLFRVGELATGSHPVMVQDVHIALNKKKFKFVLRTSKTHGEYSKPQIVKITSQPLEGEQRNSDEINCPYQFLRNYSAIRPEYLDPEEPFFVLQDRTAIKPELVRKVLKELLKKAGFEAKFYNFHSFRAGRTLDLRKIGIKIDDLMELGRWASSSVYTYLKQF